MICMKYYFSLYKKTEADRKWMNILILIKYFWQKKVNRGCFSNDHSWTRTNQETCKPSQQGEAGGRIKAEIKKHSIEFNTTRMFINSFCNFNAKMSKKQNIFFEFQKMFDWHLARLSMEGESSDACLLMAADIIYADGELIQEKPGSLPHNCHRNHLLLSYLVYK